MKKELRISTFSIVCVLCAMTFGAADAAAPVRALGGAGTYSSASSAASAKATTAKPAATTSTSSKAATSTRAGVMRVLPKASTANKNVSTSTSSGGTVVSGTRASASPRLSIGKYLPNRVVNKPTVDSASQGDLEDLTGRVKTLEDKVFDGKNGLEAQLIELQDKVAQGQTDLTAELTEIDATFVTVNTDIETIEKDIASLSGDFDTEKSAMAVVVEDIKNSIEDVKTTSGTDFTAVRTSIDKLNTDLTALTARVSALEVGKQDVLTGTKYITVNQETDIVELNLDALTEEINTKINAGAIAGVTIDFDTTTNTLEWTVPGTQTEYVKLGDIFIDPAELKVAEDKIDGMITAIDTRVTALEADVKSLQGTVGTGTMTVDDKTVATIIEAVNALDARADEIVSATGSDSAALAGRVTTLETSVNDAEKGLVTTYNIATTNKATIEDNESGLATAHTLIGNLDDFVTDGDAATGTMGLPELTKVATAAIPNVSTVSTDATDGKYVLTADVAGDVTTYKWEKIARGLLD